jgi:transposase
VLLDSERSVRFKRTVSCTPHEVEAAIKALPIAPAAISAAVEPVCGWRWFSETLEQHGINVHIGNPLRTRLIAESRLKHDTLDAQTLADLLKSGFLPESYRVSKEMHEIRALIRERGFLVKARTAVKNRIHGVYTREGSHRTMQSPQHKSGQQEMRDTGDTELARMLALSDDLTVRIGHLDTMVRRFAKQVPLVELLKTMPGVGDITALTVVGEAGDFARFRTAEKFAAFAGLVPSQRSSGASVRFGHITRAGSALLRSTMVEAACRIRSAKTDERLYSFYERVKAERGLKRARVALARKMLTIMWHMVMGREAYRPLSSESAPKRDDLVANLSA